MYFIYTFNIMFHPVGIFRNWVCDLIHISYIIYHIYHDIIYISCIIYLLYFQGLDREQRPHTLRWTKDAGTSFLSRSLFCFFLQGRGMQLNGGGVGGICPEKKHLSFIIFFNKIWGKVTDSGCDQAGSVTKELQT